MALTKVRHTDAKNESLQTKYGLVKLDEKGFVTNLDELTGSPEQVVTHLPGFVDGERFPPALPSKPVKAAPAPTPEPEKKVEAPTSSEEDDHIMGIIKTLETQGAAKNSEGYLDMGVLNEKLRELGMKPITGLKRKELTDKARAQDTAG